MISSRSSKILRRLTRFPFGNWRRRIVSWQMLRDSSCCWASPYRFTICLWVYQWRISRDDSNGSSKDEKQLKRWKRKLGDLRLVPSPSGRGPRGGVWGGRRKKNFFFFLDVKTY